MVGRWVAIDGDATQFGHRLAALVADRGLAHDELERAALLVVDVLDALAEGQAVARMTPGGGRTKPCSPCSMRR
jgi:hypothetical protein